MSERYAISDNLGSGARTVLFVVLDSLRLDGFLASEMPNLDHLCCEFHERFSYATWTQPSHTCLLNGLLPYESVPGSAASAIYERDLGFWAQVLAGNAAEKRLFPPTYSLADFARRHRWRTIGHVAMPVLNPEAGYGRGFDSYTVLRVKGNVGAQFEEVLLEIEGDRNFIFINDGDTHYPYLMPGSELPTICGLHGAATRRATLEFRFSNADLEMLRASQREAAELFDRLLPDFLDTLPKPVLFIVTSDHGELFGEGGYFGHGPFHHPLLTHVPLALGVIK
jgi:hypothetical protein